MAERSLDIENLLRDARSRKASDLFLIPEEPPAMRIDGVVQRTEEDPLSPQEVKKIAEDIVGRDELNRIGREVGEVHRSLLVDGNLNAHFCVARSGGNYTVTAAITLSIIPDVKTIAVPEAMLKAASSPNGLVIFSGPTGSGKTTTAYSVVDHINANSYCHICTVEDPIGIRMNPKKAVIQQREVGVDVPDMFSGIHAALRQDVDVLFIGEIQTIEDLKACINLAETGHMVITQLHASTPEDAIQKMIDVFSDEMKGVIRKALANVLRGVSSQVLIHRSDRPGRVPAYGVLIPDDEMRQAIAEGRDFMSRRTPMPEGCQSIRDHIEQLKSDGIISQENADKALAML